MEKLIVENSILIKGDAVSVWDALINPEKTKNIYLAAKLYLTGKLAACYFGKETMKEKKWFL